MRESLARRMIPDSLWKMTIDDRNARSLNAKYTLPLRSYMISEPHCYLAFEKLAALVYASSLLLWLSNTSGVSDGYVNEG
jgi:hypothetical protein